jgi:hypothetical protein
VETADNWRFDRGGRALDVLTEFGQLGENIFARYTEFFGDGADAGFAWQRDSS